MIGRLLLLALSVIRRDPSHAHEIDSRNVRGPIGNRQEASRGRGVVWLARAAGSLAALHVARERRHRARAAFPLGFARSQEAAGRGPGRPHPTPLRGLTPRGGRLERNRSAAGNRLVLATRGWRV